MPDYPLLNPDFRDVLIALSAEGAEFLVVGAYAVAAHGAPRSTGDLDVLVRPTVANARRVWGALVRFGAPLNGVTLEDFHDVGTVYQMGVPPGRIDIITEISGVDFERAWAGRKRVVVDGLGVDVLGLRELLENKRASGRDKDLFDVNRLEKAAEVSRRSAGAAPRRPARRRASTGGRSGRPARRR